MKTKMLSNYKTRIFRSNILIGLLLLLCFLFTVLIVSNQVAIEALNEEIDSINSINTIGLNEAQTYKLLYDNLKYSNDKIIDTVYWSLGGISVAVFALFGANVFYNFKANKAEINNLRQTMNLKTTDFHNKLIEQTDKHIKEYANNSSIQIKEYIDNIFKEYSKTANDQISLLDSKYTQINKSLVNNIEKCDNNFSKTNKSIIDQTEGLQGKIKLEKNRIMRELYLLGAEVYLLKGIPNSSLQYHIKSLLIEIEVGYSIEMHLNDVIELMKSMTFISTTISGPLNQLLEIIPSKHQTQIEVITGLYKNLMAK